MFGWQQPWLWHKATLIQSISANQLLQLFTKTGLVSSPPVVLCWQSSRFPASLYRKQPSLVLRRKRSWDKPMILFRKLCTWTVGVKANGDNKACRIDSKGAEGKKPYMLFSWMRNIGKRKQWDSFGQFDTSMRTRSSFKLWDPGIFVLVAKFPWIYWWRQRELEKQKREIS